MAAMFATLFLFITFFASSGADLCYNATGPIENGRLQCRETKNNHYDEVRVFCDIYCNPGYEPQRSSYLTCRDIHPDYYINQEILVVRQKTLPFEGRWEYPIKEAKCVVRTECSEMSWQNKPTNGKVSCSSEGNSSFCLRSCNFPYVPQEPEFVNEHCSPETQFEWSHFLRTGERKMPPCEYAAKCNEPKATDHGHFVCEEVDWANTSICQLQCDLGYYPANVSEVFCGPSSVWRWSHEWLKKAIGCTKSPLTVEAIAAGPCDELTDNERNQLTQRVLERFRTRGSHLWKEVSRGSSCALEDDTWKLHISMEVQDLCDGGTCRLACDVVNVENQEQCYELCKKNFMNKGEMLNQMRKGILHYIGAQLRGTEVQYDFPFGYTFEGLSVSAADIEYTGGRNPYGPGSDFCPSPK